MNRSVDELLIGYYETLQQCNARGRDKLFAELTNSSVKECRRRRQKHDWIRMQSWPVKVGSRTS